MQQKEEQTLLRAIDDIFEEAGAKLIYRDAWGKRGLAYKIGGTVEGNFVVLYHEMDPSKVKEVDRQLRILKGVLRHLIVKPPKKYRIISYAERFVQWQQERVNEEQRLEREREDRLKEQVVARVVRQAQAAPQRMKKTEDAKEPTEKPVLKEKELTEGLEKIISDTDLNI